MIAAHGLGLKQRLPAALTTFRLLLGPVALACAALGVPRWAFLPILVTGTLSDIFDGVLARRYGVATPELRRYDSITDVVYHLFLLGAVWKLCRSVVSQNLPALLIILGSQGGAIAFCALKFRKYPATHSYLAKFFGLCLLAGLIALLAFGAGGWVLVALAVVAAAANLEVILIHLVSTKPPVDVRSICHALSQRQ